MTAVTEGVLVFVVGLVRAIRRRERVRRDVALALLVVAVLAGVESAIGLLNAVAAGGAVAATHRWTAHGLVIMVWCLTVITIAAALVSLRRRPVIAITSGACVVVVLSLVILESFTGYLGRSALGVQAVAAETRMRFYVLHELVLPCLAITTAIAGGLTLRRANRAFASEYTDRGPIRAVKSENPYASPSGD
ncbi:MAG TPA: hypothetical protein VG125_20975 [Pirellulales bacterium]|jgi:hypothetical protein|nr:hypothetical protein [Pirellulales bacterium]